MSQHVDPKQTQRVRELLLDALDSDADSEALTELNEILRGADESVRADAVRFLIDDCCLDNQITTIERASELAASWRIPEAEVVAGGDVDVAQRDALDRGLLARVVRAINENGVYVAAACLLVAVGAAWHYASVRQELDRLHSLVAAPDPFSLPGMQKSAEAERGRESVARVTAVIDCVWGATNPPLRFGDMLVAGQGVSLESGVLQLTLESGARVLVEGPADFIASSASETELSVGRIAAAVPRSGRGYTVMTPTAEFVDLGTEFGVHVDTTGASSLHVFDGEVVARARGDVGVGVHAGAEEAFRFEEAEAEPAPIDGLADQFIRRVGPSADQSRLPELPVSDGLAMWLAADQIPGVADGDTVAHWPDLLVGDNKFADDALQFDERRRPKLVHDASGLAAVSFDGWSTSLETAPTEITDRQTTFVACAPGPTSYAKHPNGGVVIRSGPLALAMRKNRTPIGWMWAGHNAKPAHVGVATGKPVPALKPTVLCYEYDAVRGKATMYVNGVLENSSQAKVSLPKRSQRYLGRSDEVWQKQYFLGNLYEVVVYDSPLSAEQKGEVLDYLAGRYGVAMAR